MKMCYYLDMLDLNMCPREIDIARKEELYKVYNTIECNCNPLIPCHIATGILYEYARTQACMHHRCMRAGRLQQASNRKINLEK